MQDEALLITVSGAFFILFLAILSLVLEIEENKKRRREENKTTKISFLCHFEPSSRRQGVRQGNDLGVVTAPSDAADDEIGQNGKEKSA